MGLGLLRVIAAKQKAKKAKAVLSTVRAMKLAHSAKKNAVKAGILAKLSKVHATRAALNRY